MTLNCPPVADFQSSLLVQFFPGGDEPLVYPPQEEEG